MTLMNGLNSLLAGRGYIGLLLNLLLSTIADGILFIAIPYWIYEKTGSTALTGAAFIAEAAPRLVLTALGGALADHFGKRGVLFFSTGARIVALLGLYFAVASENVTASYAAILAMGALTSLSRPVALAAIPSLVQRENLPQANGQVNAVFSLAQVLSPFVGSLMVPLISVEGLVLLTIGLTAFSLAPLKLLPKLPASAEQPGFNVIGSLLEGLRQATKSRVQIGVLAATLLLWAGHGVLVAVAIPFLDAQAATTPDDFGYLVAALGVGMLLGGACMRYVAPKRLTATMILGLVITGVFLLSTSFSPSKTLVLIYFAIAGLGTSLTISSGLALMQLESTPAAQGRAMAALNIASEGARLLGIVAGPAILLVLRPLFGVGVSGAIMLFGAFVTILLGKDPKTPPNIKGRGRLT